MGWDDVDLKDVNPNYELVAKGDYTFQIKPGAHIDDYGRLNFAVTVESEGPYRGRNVFINLPAPDQEENKWVPKTLKRLEQAVGIEQDSEAGEKLVAWVQRLGENFARFGAPLDHRTYKTKDGDDKTTEKVKLDKARPAA